MNDLDIEEVFNEEFSDLDNTIENTIDNEDFNDALDDTLNVKDMAKKVKEGENIDDLLVNPKIDKEELDDIQKEMFDVIAETDKSAWEKGEGISCKFKSMVDKLNGIQPGLAFIGAQANMGKSGFLLQVGYSATVEDDVYSLYFSLDDSARDLLPRIIASEKKVPINAVRLPETYSEYPSILKRREEGMRELYDCIDRFKMMDQSHGTSIEFIEKTIMKHYEYIQENSDKKLFVQIDNFHDISVKEKNFYDDNSKYEYIAKRLNKMCETLKLPIWCTAQLRKSANNTRPKFGDIKSATNIGYIAKLALMCFNEVSVEKENAKVFYINESNPGKSPIFEIHFDKNKLSSFKGRLYNEFIPEYALYEECYKKDMERYNNKIYQNG